MICTSCGATIADKAIICYRCGAPTATPAPRASAPVRRQPWMLVAVVVVVVAAGVLVRACSLV